MFLKKVPPEKLCPIFDDQLNSSPAGDKKSETEKLFVERKFINVAPIAAADKVGWLSELNLKLKLLMFAGRLLAKFVVR